MKERLHPFPLFTLPEAPCLDLLVIADYVSDDNWDGAQQLKQETEAKTAALLEYPKLHRAERVSGTCVMVVRANYIVVYTKEDRSVRVVCVLHAAQYWP